MEAVHDTLDTRKRDVGELFDRIGPELCRLAGVLTADADCADELVLTAIAEHRADGSCRSDLRILAGAIFLDWASRETVDLAAESSGDGIVGDLRGLPHEQLAAIALCRYGGHSYRQAADLLGLPAAELAQILCAALRNLARPDAGQSLTSVA